MMRISTVRVICRGTHSREVIVGRAGIVLNAECHANGCWVARVWLSQNSELGIGESELDVGQITMPDVLGPPIPASNGGDGPFAKCRVQSDHDVRFFVTSRGHDEEGERGFLSGARHFL